MSSDQYPSGRTIPDLPRLIMIDIAKGLGILLIVIGHNQSFEIHQSSWAGLLASFRLPFFFFMSGVMFSVANRNLKDIAITRADAWLKPFAVVAVFSGLLNVMYGNGTLESVFMGLLFGTGFTLVWAAIWFLPHLWLLYVSTAALVLYCGKWINSRLKCIVILLVTSTTGYFLLKVFGAAYHNSSCRLKTHFDWSIFDCGLPLSADLLLLTASYFLAGYFVSRRVKDFKVNTIALMLSAGILAVLYLGFGFRIDFNMRRYDDFLISTLQAFCGIYVMLCLCQLCAFQKQVAAMLSYAGRASLFILLFHMPIQDRITNALSPRLHNELLVCVAGFVLSIAVSIFLWEVCKRSKWLSLLMLPVKRTSVATPRTIAMTSVAKG